MGSYDIYKDIAARTQGALYIGVVGPVRTGKSTFIKRFLEKLVLPVAAEENRAQIRDETPQSSSGKTIMTTEPKFVPARPADVRIGDTDAKIRLIDCVGFPVEGAMGLEENGEERLVNTPWQEDALPFSEAARVGTEKVIREHATVAVLVTTDGSITDLPRENYVPAEEKTVSELKKQQKPFLILLNCRMPQSEEAQALRAEMEKKYGCRVLSVNAEGLDEEDLLTVLRELLFEFPVTGIDVQIPDWMRTLPVDNPLIASVAENLREVSPYIEKMKDCSLLEGAFAENENLDGVQGLGLNLSEGRAECVLAVKTEAYYRVLSEVCGAEIGDDCSLLRRLGVLAESKREYDRVKNAFLSAQERGYGVVTPSASEIRLEEPKETRQGANVGIRLTASAPSYHVLKVDVTSSVNPVVGAGENSEIFVKNLLADYRIEEERLWKTELFGKTLKELVEDGLEKKSGGMSEVLQKKMQKTLGRIVNDGKGNVLCILI